MSKLKTEPKLPQTIVSHSNSIDTKIEIVSINEKLSIHFLYVPDGYVVSKLSLSEHKTEVLGRLKQFNKLKYLKSWRKENENLVKIFTEVLEKRGWDFVQFPNPVAYASYYCD